MKSFEYESGLRVVNITSAAAPTINTDACDMFVIAMQVGSLDMSKNLTGSPSPGSIFFLAVTANSTYAYAWGSKFENGTYTSLPSLTTTTRQVLAFLWNPVTKKWAITGQG
jgi:hypothetical protein